MEKITNNGCEIRWGILVKKRLSFLYTELPSRLTKKNSVKTTVIVMDI